MTLLPRRVLSRVTFTFIQFQEQNRGRRPQRWIARGEILLIEDRKGHMYGMRSCLDYLIRVGFVVLSSVGAHPRAQRRAPADERTTEPDQLLNAQNTKQALLF